MKKIISFILVFSIMFAITLTPVYASSDKSITFQMSEIEFMKYLSSLTDEELLSKGCTEEEVFNFRNYDYNQDLLNFAQKRQL